MKQGNCGILLCVFNLNSSSFSMCDVPQHLRASFIGTCSIKKQVCCYISRVVGGHPQVQAL
jgi:hypothetical protein